MLPWLPPRRAQIVVHGRKPGDFAFRGPEEFLISERAKSAFEREGLRGLASCDEVEITSTIRLATVGTSRYFYAEIPVQPGADFDASRSDVELSNPSACPVCLAAGISAIRGFVIDPESWLGADVFEARGLPGVVVVSAAFRAVVETYELSNAQLVPTESYTWDPLGPR
jgi:hypothetical protein